MLQDLPGPCVDAIASILANVDDIGISVTGRRTRIDVLGDAAALNAVCRENRVAEALHRELLGRMPSEQHRRAAKLGYADAIRLCSDIGSVLPRTPHSHIDATEFDDRYSASAFPVWHRRRLLRDRSTAHDGVVEDNEGAMVRHGKPPPQVVTMVAVATRAECEAGHRIVVCDLDLEGSTTDGAVCARRTSCYDVCVVCGDACGGDDRKTYERAQGRWATACSCTPHPDDIGVVGICNYCFFFRQEGQATSLSSRVARRLSDDVPDALLLDALMLNAAAQATTGPPAPAAVRLRLRCGCEFDVERVAFPANM